MHSVFTAGLLFLSLCLVPLQAAHAETLAARVAGFILLDVQAHGEAWYVSPPTLERYYLKDGPAAYTALETFGLGITTKDLEQIPVGILGQHAGSNTISPFAQRLSGRILLQVEAHGEAWYVNPADHHRYYLADGEAAYAIMRFLSLGITSADLTHIAIAEESPLPPGTQAVQYRAYTLSTADGDFSVHVATLPRSSYTLFTDTLATSDCEDDCPAQPLANYVHEHHAVAGIHGTYFCPPDYAGCEDQLNTFLPPVFNSELDIMINDDTLKFHHRPLVVQTTDGQLHFFRRATDFGDSLADYEKRTGLTVQAAIGNWPALIDDGVIVVHDEPSEISFDHLGTRGGIGWDANNYYLVIANQASVRNLASIFFSLGADYAMNLDGGGTAALYVNGAYRVGPGRSLPNAILFQAR